MTSPLILDLIQNDDRAIAVNRAVMDRGRIRVQALRPTSPEQVTDELRGWSTMVGGGNEVVETEHRYRLVRSHPDGKIVRGYFASGCLEYRDLNRVYNGLTSVTDIDGAFAVMRTFLETSDLWLPEGMEELRPHDLAFVLSRGSDASQSTEMVKHNALLRLARTTDNVAWIGPGAYLSCIIEGEEVVGYERPWRAAGRTDAPELKLFDLEEALERADSRYLDPLLTDYEGPGAMELIDVEFGYYAADKWTSQDSLLPVYRICLRTPGEAAGDVVQIVPASSAAGLENVIPSAVTDISRQVRRS